MRETGKKEFDVYSPDISMSSDDQKHVAEIRKFFESVIRDVFLVFSDFGTKHLDREYIRRVAATTKRYETFVVASVKDALRQIAAREFSDLPAPPVIYSDSEIATLIRNEASFLLTAAYRRIIDIEVELEYEHRYGITTDNDNDKTGPGRGL